MNANTAMVFDFSAAHRRMRRAADARPRVNLSDALTRIERCALWLAGSEISVMGFVGSTLHDPVVIVAAHPKVWSLFSGRTENPGHRQDGALRFEVWEGIDRINNVTVRWEEVSACA